MTSIESSGSTPPELFQSLIYQGNYLAMRSDVLLLRTHSGLYTLPSSEIDPREDATGFVDDIHQQTGLVVAPYNSRLPVNAVEPSFENAVSAPWPEAADAYGITLPSQRLAHYIVSRVVSGEVNTGNHYSESAWIDVLQLPEDSKVEPFSLINLKRFQFMWALSNSH